MAVAAFNTLRYANHLKQAGMSDKQAEAQTMALEEVLQTGFEDFAKKSDLDNLENRLNAKIDKLTSDLNGKIDKVASEVNGKIDTLRAEFAMMKWMMGGVFMGVVALVLRTFIFH